MGHLPYLAIGVLLVAAGCATDPTRTQSRPRTDRNLVTREDIVRSGATDAFEALRLAHTNITLGEGRGQFTLAREVQATSRGRSSFLLSPQMLLVVDGVLRLDVSALHEIPAETIAWIRVMSSMEATPLYGTNGGNGAIVVQTRIPDGGD